MPYVHTVVHDGEICHIIIHLIIAIIIDLKVLNIFNVMFQK